MESYIRGTTKKKQEYTLCIYQIEFLDKKRRGRKSKNDGYVC